MTETELTGFFGILLIVACIVLGVCAIIMPLVVILIDGKVAKIQKTLVAMEHMMRHGK